MMNMKWIKCTERMPELDDDGASEVVLVVGPKRVILQNFTLEDKWQLPMEVTHWMPLPELPKEYL